MDVCHFSTRGNVILMGDMNGRIGDIKAKPIAWDELDRNEQIELAPSWERQSQDKNMNA